MEGILLNVKNTDGGSSTATLVVQAMRSKKIFVFGELLALPQVQKMRQNSPETCAVLQALEIFAYGTFSEYASKAQASALPELNEAQVLKLRQLTVVSLASRSKSLDYSQIIRETGVTSVREAEDLVIACVYDGLLRARLDQRNQKVLVQFSASRDVRPDKIDDMLVKLAQWCHSADGVLIKIDSAVEYAATQRQMEIDEHKIVASEAELLKALVQRESSDLTLGKGSSSDDYGGPVRQQQAGGKRGGGNSAGTFGGMAAGFLGRRQ